MFLPVRKHWGGVLIQIDTKPLGGASRRSIAFSGRVPFEVWLRSRRFGEAVAWKSERYHFCHQLQIKATSGSLNCPLGMKAEKELVKSFP